MGYLGGSLLPVLVETPNKSTKKQKTKSYSALDGILSNQQKFMKTYFADIKDYRKNTGVIEEISYTFPEVRVDKWRVDGYIKGKFILVKGAQKKGKSIVKKYLFSDVWEDIQQDY